MASSTRQASTGGDDGSIPLDGLYNHADGINERVMRWPFPEANGPILEAIASTVHPRLQLDL